MATRRYHIGILLASTMACSTTNHIAPAMSREVATKVFEQHPEGDIAVEMAPGRHPLTEHADLTLRLAGASNAETLVIPDQWPTTFHDGVNPGKPPLLHVAHRD